MTEIKVLRVCLVRMEPMDCEVLKVTPALPDLPAVMEDLERLVHWVPPALQEPWWRGRRYRDLQVLMELTAPRECQETPDQRERWGPEETRDPEEWLERMACKVLLVLRERKEDWATWASLDYKGRRETKDRLARWDRRAYRELQVCRASPGSREYPASLGTQVRLAGRETPALRGWMARTGWTASRA